MTKKHLGILLLSAVAIVIVGSAIFTMGQPNADSMIDSITKVQLIENEQYSKANASKRLSLLNRFHNNFPHDQRIKTLLVDIFGVMRSADIPLSSVIDLYREAEPLINKVEGAGTARSYVGQLIYTKSPSGLAEQHKATILQFYDPQLRPGESANWIVKTTAFARLYDDPMWKGQIYPVESTPPIPQKILKISQTLDDLMGKRFEIEGTNLITGNRESTFDQNSNQANLFIPTNEKQNALRILRDFVIPDNCIPICAISGPTNLEENKTLSKVIWLESKVPHGLQSIDQPIVFYLNKQSDLLGVGLLNNFPPFMFPPK